MPSLTARDVIEVDVTAALVEDLSDEIRRLEHELADLDAAAIDAEDRASRYAPDVVASSIDFVGRVIDEMVRSARTKNSCSRKDLRPRADAADGLPESPLPSEAVPRSIGAEVPAAPLAPTPTTPATWPPLKQPIAVGTTWTADGADVAVADAPAPVGRPGAGAAGVATAGRDGGSDHEGPDEATEESAFEAFWREQDDAAEARSNALAPLDVLAPMAVLLFMLFLVLSLI